MSDLFEFDSVDPLELHLVGAPANKFGPLLAKSEMKGKDMTKEKASAGARPFLAESRPFAPFDERVARAEADFAKAKAADEPYAIAVAKSELHISRRQRTMMKMIAAENARERDPQMAIRSARGQGVPLISNRHQLGDDTSLRGV